MDRSLTLFLLVGTVLLSFAAATPAPQGYGAPVVTAYRPTPSVYNPQPQLTCQPLYTTTTVHAPQYITQTKSVIQYKTQFQTQYQTQYQTQFKTQYVTKKHEVPVYVTKTQSQYITKTEQVVGYVTTTVPSYITKTVKEAQYVTQPCLGTGGYNSGSSSGASGGYGSGSTVPAFDIRFGDSGK